MSDASPSPASIFKRSTKSKPRPRRERSPNNASLGHEASASDPLGTSLEQQDELSLPSEEKKEESPMSQVAKLKARQKARVKGPQARLSFGADDDRDEQNGGEEEFKIKKSSLSRKLKLGAAPTTPRAAIPTSLNQATISPQQTQSTPIYSKTYLSELKASTPSTPSFRARTDDNGDISMDVDYEGTNDPFGQSDSLSSIPAEASIRAAKEKRERLRALGVTPLADGDSSMDFISLSVAKQDASSTSRGPHPESRLQREDDEIGEGDEDMAEYTGAKERIALGKKSRKAEARKRKAAMVEMIKDAEEDDETQEWEAAQARRGGNVAPDIYPRDQPEPKVTYKPRPIPNTTALPALTTAMSRLSGTLSNLQASHSAHQTSLEAVNAEEGQLDEKEMEMRDMVTRAENKRAWFFDMREWMETIATFLDEKFPELEKLEEEHRSLLSERYEMIVRRRRQDDEDDLSLFLYIPPAESSNQVDDLGRSFPIGGHSATRTARRAGRDARNIVSRITTLGGPPPPKLFLTQEDQDGYYTDSELSSSDMQDYSLAREKLSFRVSSLLSDVKSDEFRDPELGLGRRFAEWREKWNESYTGAWGGLGLVGAWEFWARLEMAEWNPLEENRTVDSFHWFTALYDYSRPRNGTTPTSVEGSDHDDEPDLGPEGDLANSMISTAVIPQLCKLLSGGGFDPYSARHMKRVVDLVEQVELCMNRSDPKFQMLVKSLTPPFREAIEATRSLIVPSLDPHNPPTAFDPASVKARRQFLIRRTKLLMNLVAWRKVIGEISEIDELVRKLLVDVMLPIAQSGWDVGGQEIMSKVKASLPKGMARQEWARQLQ